MNVFRNGDRPRQRCEVLPSENNNGYLDRIGRFRVTRLYSLADDLSPILKLAPFDRMLQSDEERNGFYRQSMELLQAAELPFLVGGSYALCVYTGIARHTKDFDLLVRPNDFPVALEVFRRSGLRVEEVHPHWLGKIFRDGEAIDIIFRAGNGLCSVDDLWFEQARPAEIFGLQIRLGPPEEMIWMKSFIMERERFDGADVAHLLFHCAVDMDWNRLVTRFGPDWRVLLSHLILFGFIFPSEKDRIPRTILEELLRRVVESETEPDRVCRGTLLSRVQYLPDVREGRLRDARLDPRVGLSWSEVEAWSEAADDHVKPQSVTADN